jgi:hypothetical protein
MLNQTAPMPDESCGFNGAATCSLPTLPVGPDHLVPANTTTNGFVPAPAIATSPPMTYRDHAPPDSDSARPIASAAAHLGPLADP